VEVLFKGLYRECDVSGDPQFSNILRGLECRKKYLGQKIGDFEIVTVDYDFGTHTPINVARCVLCGKTKDIPDLGDFRRGRGVGRLCKCRYNKEEKAKKRSLGEYIGEEYNGFRVVDYGIGKGLRVECLVCGNQKWASRSSVIGGVILCNHNTTNDYSDQKWIDMRVGSLTAIGRLGRKYRFRCDCGVEVIHRPGDVFRQSGITSCGRWECEYRRKILSDGDTPRKAGVAFEFECAAEMERQGFEVEVTPSTGDYGVDFFAMVDGERVAFQCKRLKKESVVRAVQEVYAGGCYYDCSRFIVVSPTGFSHRAEIMAFKLGVQLKTNLRNFTLSDYQPKTKEDDG
jgi:hypothetical protein